MSSFVLSSQTVSRFGYDLGDLGNSKPDRDARSIRERSKIEEGSGEPIYVISMEDSEGPFGEVMASLCIQTRGIHLNRKSDGIGRSCDAQAAFRETALFVPRIAFFMPFSCLRNSQRS